VLLCLTFESFKFWIKSEGSIRPACPFKCIKICATLVARVEHRSTLQNGCYYESKFHGHKIWMILPTVTCKSDCILQLGRTKVFLRAGQIAVLDSRRGEILDNASRILQGHFRTFIARKKFLSTRKASISILMYCRGMMDFSLFFVVCMLILHLFLQDSLLIYCV